MDNGYIQSSYDFPMCNHIRDVGPENIGYTTGITEDGFFYEAEVYEYEQQGRQFRELAVVMSDMKYMIYDFGDGDDSIPDPQIKGYTNKYDLIDHSVLAIGMGERGREDALDITMWYVDYLEAVGIVEFTTNVRNGSLLYLTDERGTDLVQISIGLVTNGLEEATTPLKFREFYHSYVADQRKNFRIIRGEG